MDVIKLMEEAIEEERRAHEKYKHGAEEAADPETRSMFEQLARMEENHERMLRDRLSALKLIKGDR
ncbi:MAG: rubrerythrin [Actinobacteria bacterium]|nr:rubrerythrin [Actinomycetota bacterium]MCL5883147.1 rubrerythrin [Actinomycetota bacterium]